LVAGGVHPVTADHVVAEPASGQGHLSLHIRPLMHAAMLAVIHRHRWAVVYYLYDSDHGM